MDIETIKQIIMRRDCLTSNDADNIIEDARKALWDYLDDGDEESAYNICQEYFGLEPDYLDEFI